MRRKLRFISSKTTLMSQQDHNPCDVMKYEDLNNVKDFTVLGKYNLDWVAKKIN